MKKIIFSIVLCLCWIGVVQANNWNGPIGIYLKTNTSGNGNEAVQTNYRITSTDWGNNSYSSPINNTNELSGVDLGELTSLKLVGALYVGGTDRGGDAPFPHHWYSPNEFELQYCVYPQGTEAPDWDQCERLVLDSMRVYESNNKDYVFTAVDKNINLIALTNMTAGTYVLRVRMHMIKHYWNEDNSNGTWSDDTTPQEATFTIENYVTGNGKSDTNHSFCGNQNWYAKYEAGKMVGGEKTYYNVAAGTYQFKILTGSWDNEIGYTDVDFDASDVNVWNKENTNIAITTDATSDITIRLDSEGKVSVTSTLGRFVRTPYSVTGYGMFSSDWSATDTETEMTLQADGTYRYVLRDKNLTARSYGYRVVGEHGWAVQYPASSLPNSQVVIEEDGVYTLIFTYDPTETEPSCTVKRQQDVEISQYQFNSFYSSKAWDVPEGLQALIFTGVENDMLVMESIDIIPANTGVVLYGAANATYTLLEAFTDVTYPENMLKGTLTDTEINNTAVHYILGLSSAGECGMYWPYGTDNGVGAFTNKAGKAYIEIPAGSAVPARIRGFVLSGPRVATGIYDVTEPEADNKYYDLLGRQVVNPQHGGIYIHQGKKVVLQ